MESLKVDTTNLASKAGEVNSKADDYYNKYTELLSDVATLTSTDYTGDEANAFKDQIEGFRDDFLKMKELMNDYAKFMTEASQSYEDTQSNAIAKIKSLQN